MAKTIAITEEFENKLIKYINFHYNIYYNIEHINTIRLSTYQFLVLMKVDSNSRVYRIKYDDFSKFTTYNYKHS